MNPAYSVIFFTTASGAGYGLLVWLAVLPLAGVAPHDPARWAGGWAHALAFVLVSGGLLSSTAHLGRPERAWRAVTQWRSSWLSREGVLSLATFLPWAAFAYAGLRAQALPLWTDLSGLLAALGALATVYCTGMIYRSLPTIPAWHRREVVPVYVLLSLASGGLLALLLLGASGNLAPRFALLVLVLFALALLLKLWHWRALDREAPRYDAGSATGLGRFGTVRVLDPPHTQANFVMREMGYEVGRRHARRLRRMAIVLAFAIPMLAAALMAAPSFGVVAGHSGAAAAGGALVVIAGTVGTVSLALGLLVERWLFFAEARHVVTLFYGAARV